MIVTDEEIRILLDGLRYFIVDNGHKRIVNDHAACSNSRYDAAIVLTSKLLGELKALQVDGLTGDGSFTRELEGGSMWKPRGDGTCAHCNYEIKAHDEHNGYCPRDRQRIR